MTTEGHAVHERRSRARDSHFTLARHGIGRWDRIYIYRTMIHVRCGNPTHDMTHEHEDEHEHEYEQDRGDIQCVLSV